MNLGKMVVSFGLVAHYSVQCRPPRHLQPSVTTREKPGLARDVSADAKSRRAWLYLLLLFLETHTQTSFHLVGTCSYTAPLSFLPSRHICEACKAQSGGGMEVAERKKSKRELKQKSLIFISKQPDLIIFIEALPLMRSKQAPEDFV